VAPSSDWTTFDQNSLRTGVDASGSSFSTVNKAWTTADLDGQIYGQPLVYAGRVFAATENDTVYAFAADSGSVLWSHHLAAPVPAGDLPCGNIQPTVGITGTPVIDPGRAEIFVVADEATGSGPAHHLIGLDLYTGSVLLDQDIDPSGTYPPAQLQRVSLALDEGRVIAGFGGNSGDCSTYHGLLVSVPEAGGAAATFVVADSANPPGDEQGAIWMGGAAPDIDANGNVWVATGNSEYHSASDPYDNSDGVLDISPAMQLVQFFAPSDWYDDNANDRDLGSTVPALLPNGLVFEVGKSQTAYVLDQAHLGGVGGQVQSKDSFCFADGGSADLNGTLFVPCSDGVESVTPSGSAPPSAHWTTDSGAHGSPIVAGGMVWSIGNGNLYALNATTGDAVHTFALGSSASSFPAPAAADGLVLAPSSYQVHAFVGPDGLPGPPSPPTACACGSSPSTYDLVASDGGIFAFGGAGFYGSTGALSLNKPIVGMAATPDGRGYWLVASDGGIFAFGDARFHGSTGALSLNKPIVGMATTPDGGGYWLVASDGGIFAFGDARFYGSTGALSLNRPIVGMAATPDGKGYWLVASDGGVFAVGDAHFYGSTGAISLNRPIVGMAATPDGGGYWLVASDGGVFSLGDAHFHGSTGAISLNRPIVGMATTPDGGGYWLVASDGGIFAFGDAHFHGSTGSLDLNRPVVGMAATTAPAP
jgi:outer membrane protein assembly factor BamB